MSVHSILYFEYGMSFDWVAFTICLFRFGFRLLSFLSAIVIIWIVDPIEHIKKIFFRHLFCELLTLFCELLTLFCEQITFLKCKKPYFTRISTLSHIRAKISSASFGAVRFSEKCDYVNFGLFAIYTNTSSYHISVTKSQNSTLSFVLWGFLTSKITFLTLNLVFFPLKCVKSSHSF